MTKHKKAFRSVKGGSKKALFEALNFAKGVTAESRTLTVLNGPLKPKWLKSAKATPEKDQFGTDMELHLADDETIIPVNIKSSERGLFEHIKKRREIKGRFILCIIISSRDTDEQVVQKVVRALLRYKKGKDRSRKLKEKNKKQLRKK